MGLFARKELSPPDEALTMLTAQQAQRLRSLVRDAFARRGVEVAVLADHVRDDAGREFGLWNLAALCSGARREREWPAVVEDHVDRVLRVMGGPEEVQDLDPAQVPASVHLRLYDAEGVPDRLPFSYAQELAPGLLELLAVDLPESVALLTDEDVERLGGLADLRRAGLANLRAVRELEHEVVRRDDGSRVDLVMGDSFFTASLALVLPDLVRQTTGEQVPEDGALVCLPFRHQVAFHLLRDVSVVPTLSAMTGFAVHGYSEGAGPVSPWVFWWRQGTWTRLSRAEDDGEVVVTVPPDFAEVLNRLVAL
jgi:hypothetical protein